MHQIRMTRIEQLKPNAQNARTHSKKQVRQIANSIVSFGFANPLLVDEGCFVIAGHGRLEAAKLLGLTTVPVVMLPGLTPAKRRALALADNKVAENAGWDRERLALELPDLSKLLAEEGLDIALTGFEPVEIDQLQVDFETDASDPSDEFDPDWAEGPPATSPGDLWLLDRHRLLCGDARDATHVRRLMDGCSAAMAFTDPPYNVSVRSIGGRGRTKHAEFAMAHGEMPRGDFISFLQTTLGIASKVSQNGAVHFVCMDWRHIGELIEAAREVYGETLNIAVWVKSNAGQGSLYRSQHEFVGVFRSGNGTHLNNIELGRHGRNRSNVWRYAGVNTFRSDRMADLQSHPTVKPVALVADAMKDCTRRGDIVLDTFSGSGTTILAAERVGRRACALEFEPRYVDVAIRRWQTFTRKDAVNIATGRTFDEHAADSAERPRDAPTRRQRVKRR